MAIDEAGRPRAASGPVLSQDIFERAAALKQAGRPFVLATVIWSQRPTSAKPGAKGIVTADGALFGWVGGSCAQPAVIQEALKALADGQSRILRLDPEGQLVSERRDVVVVPMTCHSGGALEVFLEPFLPALQLLVFGESPVAQALIRLGRAMGYRVVAVRPGTDAGLVDEADLTLSTLDIDELVRGRQTVAVVATMGQYDEEAVERALRAGAGFVALVASRRRFDAVRSTLEASGLPPDLLSRVKAPAGLNIGAVAPEEIAVSILAEIIAHKPALQPLAGGIPELSEPAEPSTAVDPVCGMTVEIANARHTAEYQGRRYYFCCPACRRHFLANPTEYVHPGAGA
uniref:YHS domain-containing protein n=2 Tax=Thermorudis TaxID=1649508 RepID=A0A7C2W6M4_9BACT